ncbi:MAG: radical SAM protein [Bryobacterales bacterium]|nr:radical SAM protein [Bryobacterales bacterium]
MLHALFDHLLPGSLHRGGVVVELLGRLEAELRGEESCRRAIDVLQSAKDTLFGLLRCRHGETAARLLVIKALNILLARYQFAARHTCLAANPIGFVVDPSNVCQLSCPGCVHSSSPGASERFLWPNGTLAEPRFRELMRRFGPSAVAVYFCDYGEPLLNRNTSSLVRIAKSYGVHAMLSTSLSVRHCDAEALVESGLDFMVMSIDGASQAVYERFRRGGRLDLVLENIHKLVEARRRLGRRTPVLSWNFLAFRHNVHEIPEALRIARRLGVDQFRVVEPFDVTWDDRDIVPAGRRPEIVHMNWSRWRTMHAQGSGIPQPLDEERIRAAYDDPWDVPTQDEVRAPSAHACHWLYKNLVMDALGRVMPCCGAPTPSNNLVFTQFDGSDANPFNSENHQRGRSLFAAPGVRASKPTASPLLKLAHPCATCEWDQTKVNIGSSEIERYFRQVDPVLFDLRARRLLSDW